MLLDVVFCNRRRCIVVAALATLLLCTSWITSRDAVTTLPTVVVPESRLDVGHQEPFRGSHSTGGAHLPPSPDHIDRVSLSSIHSRCAALDSAFRSNALFRPRGDGDERNDLQPSVLECAPPYASYHVERAPVCMIGNRFYRVATTAQRFPHMNRSMHFVPLTSEEEFEAVGASSSKTDRVHFHRAVALMLTGTWNSVNWYHLLMDYLLGLCHMDLQFDALRNLPRRIVHIVNTTWNTKWGKYDQEACMEFSDALSTVGVVDDEYRSMSLPSAVESSSSSKKARRSIVVRSTEEDALHCFCGAVVIGDAHTLPRGEPHEGFRSPTRHSAMLRYKERMLAKYALETPYGEQPTVAAFTRLGYWTGNEGLNTSVAAAPRLLLVKRRRRRIANSDAIEAMARSMGYNVASVYFESLEPATQFHLSRNADVLLAIHGMALTYVANMDGTGRWAGCRSLIELMHWVKPDRFWYYQEMAPLNDVVMHRVLPADVTFGPSVLNKAKEKKLLMKNTFWWGLKGFDDQTALYHSGAVQEALRAALERWRRCA